MCKYLETCPSVDFKTPRTEMGLWRGQCTFSKAFARLLVDSFWIELCAPRRLWMACWWWMLSGTFPSRIFSVRNGVPQGTRQNLLPPLLMGLGLRNLQLCRKRITKVRCKWEPASGSGEENSGNLNEKSGHLASSWQTYQFGHLASHIHPLYVLKISEGV